MNTKKLKNFSDLKKKLLKDPEFKKAYDELEPEFNIYRSLIEKRISKDKAKQW